MMMSRLVSSRLVSSRHLTHKPPYPSPAPRHLYDWTGGQQLAKRATELELARDYSAALQAYYDAAQRYLWLLSSSPSSSSSHAADRAREGEREKEREQLKATLKKLLARAELIKKTKGGSSIAAPSLSSPSPSSSSYSYSRTSNVSSDAGPSRLRTSHAPATASGPPGPPPCAE